MATYSDAIYRIVYAWAVAFAPHPFKIVSMSLAGHQWDNRIGRANMSKDAKQMKIDQKSLERIQRADAAHQNGLESLPLFGLAVLAACHAGVAKDELDKFSKLYLLLRVLYNIFFIVGGGQVVATGRTLVWGGSVYCSITLLLRAARLLAAKGL